MTEEKKRKLLREFLKAALSGDLAALQKVIERQRFFSPEYRFLCGFLFLLEIDIDAGTVRLGPQLRKDL